MSVMTTDPANTAPPLPEMPAGAEMLRLISERLSRTPLGGDGRRERTVRGENGWEATLISRPHDLLPEVMDPLAEWWEATVRDAVLECPEPRNGRRRDPEGRGRNRIRRTLEESAAISGDIVLGPVGFLNAGFQTMIAWDGNAEKGAVTWPFDVIAVSRVMNEAVRGVFGRNWEDWQTPKEGRRPRRIFRDFSGRSDGEILRDMLASTQRPTSAWPAISGRLRIKTPCPGSKECEHEPPASRSRGGHPQETIRPERCIERMREHAEAVFEAFRAANPSLLYQNDPRCIGMIDPGAHLCRQNGRRCGARKPAVCDHDEMARFPDGETLLIAHPYQTDMFGDLGECRQILPDAGIINGGREHSWYNPGMTELVIIGTPRTLSPVNLEYEAPPRTGG